MAYALVGIAIFVSYKEKIGLGKDLLIGSVRAVVQLTVIGFILQYIFECNNVWITTALLVVMVYNAAGVSAKRGKGVGQARRISFIAISCGLVVTLGILVAAKAIVYQPNTVIPVSGMVVGNSMIAIGLLFKTLAESVRDKKDEIETKLCLGASPRQAVLPLVRDGIKTAMLPTADSMKTLGIVQLPGMMTGLILAGISPAEAIKYQIMVAFMMVGAVAVTAFVASYWAYRGFFTKWAQLKNG